DNGTSKEWDNHRDKFNKVLKWFFNYYLNRSLPGMLPPTIKGVTIHLFDLYKLIECMGGFLHVQFCQKFGALAEILSRSDGEEIQWCYIDYLEVLVSYYKTARSSRDPTRGNEDLECFKGYRCDGNMDDTMAAKKGKGQVEHFRITLEAEGNNKHQYFAHQEVDEKIKCGKCQNVGHSDFECLTKIHKPFASSSRQANNKDTQSTTSDDFMIIT
nr:ARID DNA-binding domain-containing protein [Tanacetum cinerariifolium]